MGLVFHNGSLLFVNGLPAMSTACCCGGGCCPTAPEVLRATIRLFDPGFGCDVADIHTGALLDGYVARLEAAPGETNNWNWANPERFDYGNCRISFNVSCNDIVDKYVITPEAEGSLSVPEVALQATSVACDPFRVQFAHPLLVVDGVCCQNSETPPQRIIIDLEEW